MKKVFSVAILGAGNRGNNFCREMFKRNDRYTIASVCDFNPKQIEKVRLWLDLPDECFFTDENEFFKEKRADVVVIATYDKYHVPQCLKALKLGYDVLLEKPISDDRNEINELLKVQKETGRSVTVCHELRYGPAFEKLYELICDGVVGKIMAIDATERVAYWHQAQAYVRIQSAYNDVTHPTILAKCSHDLDLVQHYARSRCSTVSSVGELRYFREENAPEDSTERCLDCPHVDTCAYSAKKIYLERWQKDGCPQEEWPYAKVTLKRPFDINDLIEGLNTTYFGKCAFKCHVESNEHVVDNQIVQMKFENGISAVLKMVFAAVPGRLINIFGTEGELLLDERRDHIEVFRYGEGREIIDFNTLIEGGHGHGGGDGRLLDELYNVLCGTAQNRTALSESVECHLMGIAAEESRLSGGSAVKVHG